MATASLPNTITAGTPAVAAEVQGNDQYLEDFLNNDVAHVDGSKPFTTHPTGPAGSPSNDLQYLTLGGLKARNKILSKRNHPTVSLNMDDGAIQESGITLPQFVMPDLSGGEMAVYLKAVIPQIEVFAHEGDTPDSQMKLQAFLRNGTTVVGYASILQGVTIGLGINDDVPTLTVEQYLFDNSKITAGANVNIKLEGRLAREGGRMQFIGTTDAPIQMIARLES
jgi:hypothetical protein